MKINVLILNYLMLIFDKVHVKGRSLIINCGDGAQKVRWLADCAILRFDDSNGMLTGFPKGVRFENGTLVNMEGVINEHLQDESHVWVILKEERDSKDSKTKSAGKEKLRAVSKKV